MHSFARRVLAVMFALALAVAVACACAPAPAPTSAPTPEPASGTGVPVTGSPPGTAPGAPTTIATGRPGAPMPVGTRTVELADAARGRTLRTFLYYPATGAGGPETPPAPGSYPLVLMAHGYRLPAGGYPHLLSTVAAAGYVVASPAFPRTSAEVGDGYRGDITNQPADLSFVADALTGPAPPPGLPAIAQPDRVGAMGHSDGGLTVSAWAFGTAFGDPRVAAAVVMTGGMALFPTTYFPPGSPPLLAVHATGDETNPYSASVNLFTAAPAGTDRFLLTVDGGSHLGPYMFDTPVPEVERAVVAFLDLELRGDASARDRLLTDADRPGVTAIRVG